MNKPLSRRSFVQCSAAVTGTASIAGLAGCASPPPVPLACSATGEMIHGHCPLEFSAVREAFEKNFSEREELGADICLYLGGEEILHLWGGYADNARTKLWMRDTLVIPASAIKGLYPFCVHKLVEQGHLEYDEKVSAYWPEFAQNGKEQTTVRHLVSHWAGLEETFPIDVYTTSLEDTFAVMEAAEPSSPPGTKGAYHSQTHMPLIAGLVYKATGERIESYFRREIAGPMGLDAYLKIPASETVRAADYIVPAAYAAMLATYGLEAEVREDMVTEPHQMVEANYMGVINGRGLARLTGMAANGGSLDGVRLFEEATTQAWNAHQWSGESLFPGGGDEPMYANLGWLTPNTMLPFLEGDSLYMMAGAGGSIGLADPDRKLGFGYTLNRWHTEKMGMTMGSRATALLQAVYSALV